MSTSLDVEPAPAIRWASPAAGVISPLLVAWRNWRKTRQYTASLSALSDHHLRDIGFFRDHGAGRIVRRP